MAIRQRKESGAWQADFCHKNKRYRRDFENRGAAEAWVKSEGALLRARDRGVGENTTTAQAQGVITMQHLRDRVATLVWKGTKNEKIALKNADDCLAIIGPDREVCTITSDDVDLIKGVMRKKGVKDSTINRKLMAFSKLLTFALRKDWLAKKPTMEQFKETEGRLRWYTPEEEASILTWLADNHPSTGDLVAILIDSGLRRGELLSLDFASANTQEEAAGIIVWADVNKTSLSRRVPMTERVRGIIARRRLEHPEWTRVFEDLTGDRANHFWDMCRKALGKLDDPEWVLHVCRHTFCTRLLMAGVDLAVIKDLAGHACFETTLRYAKVLATGRTDAIHKMVQFQQGVQQADSVRMSQPAPKSSHICDGVTQTHTQGHMRRVVSA